MTKYKKFRVGDILSWEKKIQIRPLDIPYITIENGKEYPFVGQSSTNNAIVDYLRVESKYLNNKESEPCIIASSNTQEFSFINTPFFLKEAGGSMSYMKNKNLNKYNSLYLITVLKKELKSRYTYGIKATNERIRESIIELPVKSEISEEPDWDYMEKYIKDIENKYMKLIEKYISNMGYKNISDVIITEEDKAIILEYKNAKFKKFRLDEIFNTIKRGKRIRSLDRIDGKLPFITAGIEKMGFSSFIGNPEAEVFPSNSLTIDMFGNTFYRGYKYGADDHVAILFDTNKQYSKKILQYMQTSINKSISGKFSYSRNFYASDAPEVEIYIPVKEDNSLDTELIDRYMRVIEKKVIYNLRLKMDKIGIELR